MEAARDKFQRPAPEGAQFYIAGGGETWDPPFKLRLSPGIVLERDVLVFDGIIPADFQVVWQDTESAAALDGWVWSPVFERFRDRLGVHIDKRGGNYLYRPVDLLECE
jgi:hypothetical protein